MTLKSLFTRRPKVEPVKLPKPVMLSAATHRKLIRHWIRLATVTR